MCTLSYSLARYCGAVLLGRKPAGLFNFYGGPKQRQALAELAAGYGLKILCLRRADGRALLLVYDPALLVKALADPIARYSLAKLGYPAKNQLGHLAKRFRQQQAFPHEIGFFLGYPPIDVVGFIFYGGKNCKHSCLWKVYGDVESARRLCADFAECRRLCCRHVEDSGFLPPPELLIRSAVTDR